MALLDDVLDAHGGIDRWRGLKKFTAHVSIGGALLAAQGRDAALKDVVAEGCMHTPSVRLTGVAAPDRCGVYRPDHAAIETLDGASVASRGDPRAAFPDPAGQGAWDDLHLVCFSGICIWNCIAGPFLLAAPGIETEELESSGERGEPWQQLRAVFPVGMGTLAEEQIFYFDANGWQRRVDYAALESAGTRIAHYSWSHQAFSGVVVPTLHRCLVIGPDGRVVRKPPRVDVEIFDVAFE